MTAIVKDAVAPIGDEEGGQKTEKMTRENDIQLIKTEDVTHAFA